MSDEQKAPTLGDKIRSFARDGRMLGLSEARIGWLEGLAAEADELDALVCRDAYGNVIRPGDVVRSEDRKKAFVVNSTTMRAGSSSYASDGFGTSFVCRKCSVMRPATPDLPGFDTSVSDLSD